MLELKASLNDLAAAVALVAGHTGIPTLHVEKDFWIVEALRACQKVAADRDVELVLKGGTSLSKGYKLIDRFSEDIDLIVVFDERRSPESRHRVFRAMAGAAGEALSAEPEVDGAASERGVKRPVFLQYPRASTPREAGIRPEGLLLELGTRGGTWPTETVSVVSLITEYGPEVGIEPDYAESEPVAISVLAPIRTLIEKLLILHDAACHGDEQRKRHTARHYYDVNRLLMQVEITDRLTDTLIDEISADVAERSADVGLPVIDPPEEGFATSPAFDAEANLVAASSYRKQVLEHLVCTGAEKPTFEECCDRVRSIFGGAPSG